MAVRARLAHIASLLIVLPVLAGCLDGGGDGEGDGGAMVSIPVVPSDEALAGVHPFGVLLCKDGYHVFGDIGTGAIDVCNHRVSLPLRDPTLLDVVTQHGPGNEVSVAVNPLDPLNAAGGAKDYTVSYVSDHAACGAFTVWMGTFQTFDGGLTWGNDLMRGFPGDTRDSPLSGNDCNTDPVLVFDDDGTLWYSGLNYRGGRDDLSTAPPPGSNDDAVTGSQLYFAKSTDGGASYPEISFASFGDNQQIFNDKQWFALQPGGDHMIVTWSNFIGPAGGVIMYSESLDGGATWGPPTTMPPGQTPTNTFVQFSMPQYVRGGGTLVVIWVSNSVDLLGGGTGLASVVAYTEGVVTPAGVAFAPPRVAFPYNPTKSGSGRDGSGPSTFRHSTIPVLAIDTSGGPYDGRRYIAWADQPGALDSDIEVLLRWSDDGLSWSDPVVVNDASEGDQFMPWIETDSAGGVHVAWYDRRNDPDNRMLDVYYAYSDDGGATFHPNVRVSETNFDGDLGLHQNGSPFIGDYIGLDATPDVAYVMWADTRHTGQAGREEGSDVYAATLLRDLGTGTRGLFDPVFATAASGP